MATLALGKYGHVGHSDSRILQAVCLPLPGRMDGSWGSSKPSQFQNFTQLVSQILEFYHMRFASKVTSPITFQQSTRQEITRAREPPKDHGPLREPKRAQFDQISTVHTTRNYRSPGPLKHHGPLREPKSAQFDQISTLKFYSNSANKSHPLQPGFR